MGKVLHFVVYIAVAGLAFAILRAFDWDIFAAIEWGLRTVWDLIMHVADIWSSNSTFRDVTKK